VGQDLMHAQHLMHKLLFDTTLSSTEMAAVGQTEAHVAHFEHIVSCMTVFIRSYCNDFFGYHRVSLCDDYSKTTVKNRVDRQNRRLLRPFHLDHISLPMAHREVLIVIISTG
jgi:hypothetical protein